MNEIVDKRLIDADGAPLDRIVGFETEYGLHFRKLPRGISVLAVEEAGRHDRKCNGGEYTAEGERIYVDIGPHPEYSTAEDTVFLGAAYRQLSGHIKMANRYRHNGEEVLKDSFFAGHKGAALDLVANTCDAYGNSWGNHENLLAPRALELEDYAPALVAHHLSRIVWSGAGHIQLNDKTFRFVLSEKADHLWEGVSGATTRARPLLNTRDNPYADAEKYRRIHNVSGESVISPFVNALRLASGSIVLRACEIGVSFEDLALENPLQAIRQISNDPTLKQTVKLADGRSMTGLDLQEEIASRSITAAKQANYLTEQEKQWAIKWELLLADLKTDPAKCMTRLNWMVKQRLIERELLAKSHNEPGKKAESRSSVAWHKSQDFHRLLPVEGAGMKLLRKGFFDDSQDVKSLEAGMPLPFTRARLRGNAIRQLEDIGIGVAADWAHVLVPEIARTVVLKDPFALEDERVEALIKMSIQSRANAASTRVAG